MPQLDGLRTVAVAAVVLRHFRLFSYGGGHGVHLFFVLSGFLITGILLAERSNVAEMRITRGRAFLQFYARRALRIFPLYYFVVLVSIALNIAVAREYSPWLLTYTINLKMAAQGWYIAHFAHFWSLAIEEQYYLVWPWLILLLPRRALVPAALTAIAIGPLFRLYEVTGDNTSYALNGGIATYIATPTALDSLGMGSLIAILGASASSAEKMRRAMKYFIPLVAFSLVIALRFFAPRTIDLVWFDTATALLFGWLVYTASRGFGGIVGGILSAAPIVYLGRISYGIYVYHPLVRVAVMTAGMKLGIKSPGRWTIGLFDIALTILIASISWYVLERPMNQLKRKFPYATRQPVEPAASAQMQPA
jgi:peptidoglycan/LPS O-acetylase OafA/YrhL